MTFGSIVRRALVAGLVAGIALGGYLWLVVEPVIDDAVALEERLAADGHLDDGSTVHTHDEDTVHTHDEDGALFSRAEQVVGGIGAAVIYSVVLAGVFGTVYAASRHRLPGRSDLNRVVWLAAVAFGALALMPALKYPSNPPAVGDPATVNQRTVQYLMLIVLSLALVWWVSHLSKRLREHLEDRHRVMIVAVTTLVAFGALLVVLPDSPDAIDPAVPAALVWDFRIRSLGGLALFWTGLGLGLGWLLDHESAREVDSPRAATDQTTGRTDDDTRALSPHE